MKKPKFPIFISGWRYFKQTHCFVFVVKSSHMIQIELWKLYSKYNERHTSFSIMLFGRELKFDIEYSNYSDPKTKEAIFKNH
jgi:hypothetical protein